MDNSIYWLYSFLPIVQCYLAFRYALKSITGQIENYSFVKLAIVLFVPIIGYYLATKEKIPVS